MVSRRRARYVKKSPRIMGILDGLLGNAHQLEPKRLEGEFRDLLIEDEEIVLAFKLVRDLIVFTNWRLFLVDKQGLTGKKRDYVAVPYKSIDSFSFETTGTFDIDSEIKLWTKGRSEPLKLEFKGENALNAFRAISHYVHG